MAVLIDHESINIPNNRTYVAAVTAGSVIVFRLARCTSATPSLWPSQTTVVTVMISVSSDGGVTWRELIGCTASGGISTWKNGTQEVVESSLTCPIPNGVNRVSVYVSPSARLVSKLTVEVN